MSKASSTPMEIYEKLRLNDQLMQSKRDRLREARQELDKLRSATVQLKLNVDGAKRSLKEDHGRAIELKASIMIQVLLTLIFSTVEFLTLCVAHFNEITSKKLSKIRWHR